MTTEQKIARRKLSLLDLAADLAAERLHRTLLDEHFRVEGRKTWFETIEEMQAVLDEYLAGYNTKRPHHGRGMNGRTPLKAFVAGISKPNRKEATTPMQAAA